MKGIVLVVWWEKNGNDNFRQMERNRGGKENIEWAIEGRCGSEPCVGKKSRDEADFSTEEWSRLGYTILLNFFSSHNVLLSLLLFSSALHLFLPSVMLLSLFLPSSIFFPPHLIFFFLSSVKCSLLLLSPLLTLFLFWYVSSFTSANVSFLHFSSQFVWFCVSSHASFIYFVFVMFFLRLNWSLLSIFFAVHPFN